MSNTNFQPIFDYLDDKFKEIREEFISKFATKDDIQRVLNAIDAGSKQLNDQENKITVLQYKSENIENWITQAAEENHIPYNS